MQYGWWTRFRINRPLTAEEKAAVLPKHGQPGVVPSQRMGLIHVNSTYIDWIDPWYADRGMFSTAVISIGFLFFVAAFVWDLVVVAIIGDPLLLVLLIAIVPSIVLLYFIAIRYEFFTYTYYPIRFNRKTRKVYVFRHPRKGGLLVVSWDKVFFHVGDNGGLVRERFKHNIRGEILDGDMVTDTFAVGHDAEHDQELFDRWEFIVRYMEGGPDAVASDPLDKYVELSVAWNWDNCLLFGIWKCDADTPAKRFRRAPVIYWFAATRWLVFKTCRDPAFSPEVEAECVVDPNDPNVWPIPEHTNQFDMTVSGVADRADERMRDTRDPRGAAIADWPPR